MMSRWAAVVAGVAMSACGRSHAYVPKVVGAPAETAEAPSGPALLGSLSDLRASLRAPTHLDYDPQSLGVAGQFVSIHVDNVGGRVVMRDKKLLTLNEPEILRKAREYGKKVEASLK